MIPSTTTIPAWAQSSVDATQVSLTITALGKTAASVLVTYAILKGVDPTLITTNVQTVTEAAQNFVAQYVAVLPALYAAYQSIKTIEGVGRKVWVRLFTKAPSSVMTIGVSNGPTTS